MSVQGDEELAATAQAVVRAMLARDRFSAWLGVEVRLIGVGQSEATMTVRDDMINGFGIAHGGIVFSLADSVMAFASNARGRIAVALTNTISYPKAVRAGDKLTAIAIERAVTGRTATYDVNVTSDGETVALFRGVVFLTDRTHEIGDTG